MVKSTFLVLCLCLAVQQSLSLAIGEKSPEQPPSSQGEPKQEPAQPPSAQEKPKQEPAQPPSNQEEPKQEPAQPPSTQEEPKQEPAGGDNDSDGQNGSDGDDASDQYWDKVDSAIHKLFAKLKPEDMEILEARLEASVDTLRQYFEDAEKKLDAKRAEVREQIENRIAELIQSSGLSIDKAAELKDAIELNLGQLVDGIADGIKNGDYDFGAIIEKGKQAVEETLKKYGFTDTGDARERIDEVLGEIRTIFEYLQEFELDAIFWAKQRIQHMVSGIVYLLGSELSVEDKVILKNKLREVVEKLLDMPDIEFDCPFRGALYGVDCVPRKQDQIKESS